MDTPRQNKVQHTKKKLFEAMQKSLGIVTHACKIVGVDRGTFYHYYNEDPEFKAQIDDIKNETLDFVEGKLLKKINQEDTACIIFYLKTQGKNRGYVERVENEITMQQPVIIDWTGNESNTDTETEGSTQDFTE